jgi:hypothetical protein
MGQELQVPAVFQQRGMAKAFAGHVDLNDNLADGIGQSYPVIAYKGKIWALRHRGERKIVTRSDDGSPSGHLDVVILEAAKGKSKSFYKAYDANTAEGDRPICASIDGVVPDNDVTQKQSDTCALCPRNVWKTDATTGRKGRECTDYKRLAVLVMPSQTTPLFGAPLMEPMFLRVPPDSLNSLAIMGTTMTHQGYHYSTYLTRISFDPQKAHPCMVFRPVQPLSDTEAEVVLELKNSPVVARITGGEVALQGPREISHQMAPAGTLTTGLTAPVTKPAPQPEPEVENTGLAMSPAPEAPQKRTRAKPVKEVLEAATQPGGNGHADSGMSEPSDDELDAEIAKLISK